MIHELLGTKNNTIDLNGRDDVADELKQLTLSASSDEFYRHNMYANFGEIGQTIQKLVQSFQEKVIQNYCIYFGLELLIPISHYYKIDQIASITIG